tara:strand:+ start:678 stop:980 length:303 start_codon:yes stop_codon:yes gene_type:complete
MSKKTTVTDYKKDFVSSVVTEGSDNNDFHINTVQNVAPVLEHVKQLSYNKPGKDFRHVAEVPIIVYNKAVREGWVNDRKAWKKWLNDPDNKLFRTWKGKV